MDLFLKKFANHNYAPDSPADFESSAKIKIGDYCKYEDWAARNVNHHRKFFALLKLTLDNLPERFNYFQTTDNILEEIKLRAGHYETIVLTNGKAHLKTKSISFRKMDQHDFEKFYSKALDIIMQHFLVDTNRQFIEDNLTSYM